MKEQEAIFKITLQKRMFSKVYQEEIPEFV